MNLTETELIEIAREMLEPEELVEILQLTSSELAEQFSHKLVRHSKDIQSYLYPEGEDEYEY